MNRRKFRRPSRVELIFYLLAICAICGDRESSLFTFGFVSRTDKKFKLKSCRSRRTASKTDGCYHVTANIVVIGLDFRLNCK